MRGTGSQQPMSSLLPIWWCKVLKPGSPDFCNMTELGVVVYPKWLYLHALSSASLKVLLGCKIHGGSFWDLYGKWQVYNWIPFWRLQIISTLFPLITSPLEWDSFLLDLWQREDPYEPCHGSSGELHQTSPPPSEKNRAIRYIQLNSNLCSTWI